MGMDHDDAVFHAPWRYGLNFEQAGVAPALGLRTGIGRCGGTDSRAAQQRRSHFVNSSTYPALLSTPSPHATHALKVSTTAAAAPSRRT